jgi:Fe-S-cluster-containing dehydrogenase component
MTRLGLLIDITKCSGCHNCFLACRDEYYDNDYSPYSAPQPLDGQFWMQVPEIERGSYPKVKVDYIPTPCVHCEDAPCVAVAADNAVYRRPDGFVIIDPVKSKGQKAIVSACPYRVVFWNKELDIPQKCTMCAHRLDEGAKEPRCVEGCPTGALTFGDLDDPDSTISKYVAAKKTEAFHPEYGTKPTVMYVGVPKRFVAGEVVRADNVGECAEGVTITLDGGGAKLETKSDSYGDFEFEGLDKNTAYKVTVALAGYASKVFDVNTHFDVNLGEIVLEKA